ncbi:MAG: hypothetical protein CO040_04025, partial [Candidatus Pacebacteria bacterium CG_4_9_14_0_2_um_filter_36_8]
MRTVLNSVLVLGAIIDVWTTAAFVRVFLFFLAFPNDIGGFMELAKIIFAPFYVVYILLFVLLLFLLCRVLYVHLTAKNEATNWKQIFQKLQFVFLFMIFHSAPFIFLGRVEAFGGIDFLAIVFDVFFAVIVYSIYTIIVSLGVYGIYRLIRRFYRSKLFWIIFSLVSIIVLFFVIEFIKIPPSAILTAPDG